MRDSSPVPLLYDRGNVALTLSEQLYHDALRKHTTGAPAIPRPSSDAQAAYVRHNLEANSLICPSFRQKEAGVV